MRPLCAAAWRPSRCSSGRCSVYRTDSSASVPVCRVQVVPTEKAFFREYNGYTEYNPWHNPRARANYTTASVIKVKGVPNIPFHSESHKVGSVVKEDSVLEFMRRRLPRQSFAFYAAPARRA